MRERTWRVVWVLLAVVWLAGCAARSAYDKAQTDMRRERYDEAVLRYSKALALDPGNMRYKVSLERAKLKAAGQHFDKGKRFANSAQWEAAIAEFQQTLLLTPGAQHAQAELERAARELRRRQLGPSELELLKERAKRQNLGPPKLDPRSNIPIVLNFPETPVGKIFEALSKASQINFIFDDKVDLDKQMTIDIGNVTLEKALDVLMLQTKNFYKVIDDYTLLIAPDTSQKRKEYEDQVIRTFFLSNADTKQVVTLLRALLQSRQLAENAELNSLTIKDTPDKVAIAERIIQASDKAKGEVLIDVELLEINRTVAKQLGIDISNKTLSITFRDGQQALPLNNLSALKDAGSWTVGVIPSVVLSFLKSDSDTQTIAKPQLRVTEGEKAEILIGDRVPIPTTSFNTSQTVGGNIVPITSFTYQNVGITVQIEPRVHHNKEVTLRVQVEISQISGAVEQSGGQSQPIIGTRQIQTVIRLRDGETNLLAGLISRQETDSVAGVAGLVDIPGLRRVFGKTTLDTKETDLIMTLTPRIIRLPDITEEDLATLWVGTEDNMQLRGPARNALNASPFGSAITTNGGGGEEATATKPARPKGSVARTATSAENGGGTA
ncbi:MAG TPA: secretin N-terminal domain-containing protein, partial [Candidatus Polarisedimenticolaceae bacterium]|nr:secretin N-terminal domain-containing protein [Candidatus Polarisedimenticolaceae bacterium]